MAGGRGAGAEHTRGAQRERGARAGVRMEGVQQMKAGKTEGGACAASEAREGTGVGQCKLAALRGVSVRTREGWEQGRKQPSGAARTLLTIARTNPKALLAIAGK